MALNAESRDTNKPGADPGGSLSVLAIIGSVAGIASLLVAAGYLSLRAHFNYLGVSALDEIGTERILSETVPLTMSLLGTAPAAALALGLGYLIVRYLRGKLEKPLMHLARRWPRSVGYPCRRPGSFFIILFCAGCALWYAYLNHVIEGSIGMAVGRFSRDKLDAAPVWLWFIQVSVFLLAMAIGTRLVRNGMDGWPRWLAGALGAYLMASALVATPMIFGVAARPKIYTTALVILGSDAKPVEKCGLIVMVTPAQLVLWHAENGKGWITHLPRSRVHSIKDGPPDNIVKLARAALEKGKNHRPDAICDQLR